jgi:hypothetical protein
MNGRIHKWDWKPRAELEYELCARNVIYMLLDTEEKRLYFGEAQDFVGRALLHKAVDASDRYPLTARC